MTSHALVDPLPGSSATPVPNPAPARSTIWSDRIAAAGLAALGGALGASQLLQGVYNETAWAPIALGALGLVVALAVAGPRLPPMALLAPVVGLWLWSLLSAGWGDSTDAARIAADRWLLYAAAIVVLAWALARDRRRAVVLLTSASAGVLVVAAWMLARMLDGNGQSLFLATRLNIRSATSTDKRRICSLRPGPVSRSPNTVAREPRARLPGSGWRPWSPFSVWGCCASRGAGRSRWQRR